MTIDDQQRQCRELRLEIARRRRRINGALRDVEQAGRRAISWRTQVARHPVAALAAAFGAGWTVSAGLPRGGWTRWLVSYGIKTAIASLPSSVWEQAVTALAETIASLRRA